MLPPDRPVILRAVADERLALGPEEAPGPRGGRQDRAEVWPAHPRSHQAFFLHLRRFPLLTIFGQSVDADLSAGRSCLHANACSCCQLQQVLAALLERRVVGASVDDLVQHRGTVFASINAQTFALREKKPADICGSNSAARPIRLPRPASAHCAVRGPACLRPAPGNQNISETAPAAARQFVPAVPAPGPAFFPRALSYRDDHVFQLGQFRAQGSPCGP